MYFLEKLCRICVRPGTTLVDIETVDFDLVKLSEKLEICANLEISNDLVSSEICEKCVNKLRVSYHFLEMCRKSTKILQGFVDKLTATDATNDNTEKNKGPLTYQKYELSIDIDELPIIYTRTDKLADDAKANQKEAVQHHTPPSKTYLKHSGRRKQRITKVQRCSLLQQLLNKPKKERDKSYLYQNTYDYAKGGLRNIIDFTKNYEFSFNLDKNCNIETTPLDKLTAFSKNYFRRDFSEFKNHILYIIENQDQFELCNNFESDECSSDESELKETIGGPSDDLEFEEIMVEPDFKVKKEFIDNFEDEGSNCPLDYLETSFDEEIDTIVKEEPLESDSLQSGAPCISPLAHLSSVIKQEYEDDQKHSKVDFAKPISADSINSDCSITSSPAVKLLDKLVSNYPMNSRKVFTSNHSRCRTRDQPYINPILKNQFLYRSFKCEMCNRYFKSQGYLKAHTSKVH